MFGTMALLGGLLVAAAALLAVADTGGVSGRLPTQLPPRRLAWYPFVVGAVLLVLVAAGSFISG